MNIRISAFGLTALLFAASCSNDETQLINTNGDEITFNTRVSRAVDVSNEAGQQLASFKVWAHASGFPDNLFIDGLVATKHSEHDYYTFEHSVFWPSGVNSLDVWAVWPYRTAEGDPAASDYQIDFTSDKPVIKNFVPDKDITTQKDMVAAYISQPRSAGTSIPLKFNHALSQIVVKATRGANGDKSQTVKIKGAWVVNARPQGNLTFVDAIGDDNTRHMSWAAEGDKTYYGIEFDNAKELNHETTNLLAKENGNTHMLLVPQQLDTWNLNDNKDKTQNSKRGGYILVLCRVETKHPGATHDGSNDGVKPGNDSDPNHYHQLFPYTGEYKETQYGFACVPVNTNWEPGKKYVYTLTFCGYDSGAGVYPPTARVEEINATLTGNADYITAIPEPVAGVKKEVGDPVLDNPIRFTVTVEDWTDASNDGWTNGDINMN
ncbi:fimbrillin family protein [uncultured Muribaculum sp.]|uniref:fimbrillin family protein n=1 Tax=uncultured Muribaculum sp. TaxID=1918613 RepID=UPI0025F6BCCF|nr:fimbrillin family protein [uncultured Muribaculum sp.]